PQDQSNKQLTPKNISPFNLLTIILLLIRVFNYIRIVINPILVDEVVVVPHLKIPSVWSVDEPNFLENPLPILRMTLCYNLIREQGIVHCFFIKKRAVPNQVSSSKPLHIPVPVIFKSQLHTSFLYNVIDIDLLQILNPRSFSNLIEVLQSLC